jgi:putative sigma-54 modulation protein
MGCWAVKDRLASVRVRSVVFLTIERETATNPGVAPVQISISVRHGHLSEASQEKLKAKVEKVARIFDRVMSIELVVDLNDEQSPQVTINCSAEHKHDFVAHANADTLLNAFDSAAGKLEQQLRKYKEKVQERHRGPGAKHVEAPVGDESSEE